eukprot:6672442-Karenia_brevis.AAC.1
MVSSLRRRWWIVAARTHAQLLLDRLANVGRGVGAAESRRQHARLAHTLRLRGAIPCRARLHWDRWRLLM